MKKSRMDLKIEIFSLRENLEFLILNLSSELDIKSSIKWQEENHTSNFRG